MSRFDQYQGEERITSEARRRRCKTETRSEWKNNPGRRLYVSCIRLVKVKKTSPKSYLRHKSTQIVPCLLNTIQAETRYSNKYQNPGKHRPTYLVAAKASPSAVPPCLGKRAGNICTFRRISAGSRVINRKPKKLTPTHITHPDLEYYVSVQLPRRRHVTRINIRTPGSIVPLILPWLR